MSPSIPFNPESDYARDERVRGAAQDLYDALKELLAAGDQMAKAEAMDNGSLLDDTSAIIRYGDAEVAARKAIAKADGRT